MIKITPKCPRKEKSMRCKAIQREMGTHIHVCASGRRTGMSPVWKNMKNNGGK